MEKLISIGLVEVGQWVLDSRKEGRIRHEIQDAYLAQEAILYCFMSSGVPYYFGISDNSLKERMDNYKAGKEGGTAGSTNKKVHTKILEFLKNNKEVKIYILQPKYQLEYEGFEINIAKGIEHSLIKQFDSEDIWNERGSSKSKKYLFRVHLPVKSNQTTLLCFN